MEEIAEEATDQGDVWQSHRASRRARPRRIVAPPQRKADADPMPHQIKPMLATFVAEPFDRDGWLFEVKWDGYRAIAEVEASNVRLYSRNFLSFEERYQPIVSSLAELGHEAVIDGEVVVLDSEGKSKFQLLQKYQQTRRGNLVYYVFDLLYLDGDDLRDEPLTRRKELLAKLIRGQSNIRLSEHIETKGRAFFAAAQAHDLEGIIAKKEDSPYRAGVRSRDWLKIKTHQEQEAVIGGLTKPRGSRQAFGALLLGVYEEDDLFYIGHVGTGFTNKTLNEVRAQLEPLVQERCPFKTKPKVNAPVRWVKPELVCEIAFQNWTGDGHARHPVFLGLREDKPPRSIKRELPQPPPANGERAKRTRAKRAKTQSAQTATNADSGLPPGRFTNLDKVFWPEDGYTKGDLLRYYHEVAPVILPYLHDRPLSMNRHPNGIHGPNFFQKDVTKQPPPDFVETAEVDSDTSGKIRYIVCQNEETLLYVGQLGCIELNPWNSRLDSLEKPDYLVIDLDPQDVPFTQVVEVAQEVRKLLEKGCAECFCKTSGKRGLHVYIPLAARYDYDVVRQFAEVIVRLIHKRLPETTSLIRSPALRRGKVYLDYLQNRHGQTMACAYSLRPIEGALVSTPLKWSEVTKKLDPTKFNIQTVPRRLDKLGDLWEGLLGQGADMEKCLAAVGVK
jgi:bifunctional non-homologous end joining protein LigD